MELRIEDEQLMARYLLGELSADERDRIEERFFIDEDYYQNLLLAEDDLIYDYLRGALSLDHQIKIEARIQTSSGLLRKVKALEALMNLEEVGPRVETSIAEEPRVNRTIWWQAIKEFFAIRRPAFGFALAAAVLFAATSYYLITETGKLRTEIACVEAEREQERLASSERERDMQREIEDMRDGEEKLSSDMELEKQMRAQAEDEVRRLRSQSVTPALSFILMPGLTRGQDEPERLIIPKGTHRVALKLDIEGEEKYKSFRAELRTMGGNLIWSEAVADMTAIPYGKAVSVTLPSALLINGEYEITLRGSKGEQFEIFRYYYFIAIRR